MSDELKRRTADEMKEMTDQSAGALARTVDGALERASVGAAFQTGLREALELYELDPEQGKALLERIRQEDTLAPDGTPIFDMVQSARELAYDIEVEYMPIDEARARRRRIQRAFGPKTIEWN